MNGEAIAHDWAASAIEKKKVHLLVDGLIIIVCIVEVTQKVSTVKSFCTTF